MKESTAGIVCESFRMSSACDFKKKFGTKVLGARVYYLEETFSTQDIAKQLASGKTPEGTIVLAGTHKKGKGRRNKSWYSPPGGIWASLVFYPGGSLSPRIMTLAGALAVAKTLEKVFCLPARIKWPNDCMVNGRKVAGVLGESDGVALIVGIGVNVNLRMAQFPEGLSDRATSILAETGSEADESFLLGEVLRRFEGYYFKMNKGEPQEVLQEITLLSSVHGKIVTMEYMGREYTGTVLDFDSEGAIILRLDSGVQMRFENGEIKCSWQ